jgi:hypothetical protein
MRVWYNTAVMGNELVSGMVYCDMNVIHLITKYGELVE